MMFTIAESLTFDNAAELPVCSDAFWFPGLVRGSSRLTEVLVWIAQSVQQTPDDGRLYQLDRGASQDLIWVGSRSDDLVARSYDLLRLGGTPLVNWADQAGTGQLWIPYNGKVEPDVRRDDRADLIASETVNVWLPRDGLIRFEPRDGCQVIDFFSAPPESETLWQRAPEVNLRFPVIRELRPSVPPEVNELLAEGNDWIGSDAESFGDAIEDDSPRTTEKAKRWLLKKMDDWSAKKKQERESKPRQASRTPNASSPGRVGSAAGWMGAVGQSIARRLSQRMQAERQRQVEKLLSMLKTDPDRALRFALPIGGESGFRGYAMPGSKLLERLPDFSLGGIRTGGLIDNWSIDFGLQNQLRKSYYDQLSRAKAAGLHRRAAYIAAHLLGDFGHAATALEEGGHFAEAAEVYRTKLNRPQDAARCLAESGQWEQAVKLYFEIGDIETAGDVLSDAGEESEATEAYQEAAFRYRSSGRVFEAVDVLDGKLKRRDAALDLLWDQWPGSHQATASCERAMEMLSSDGRHDEVKQRIRWVGESGGTESTLAAAKVFRSVAKSTPDDEVRVLASDACRVAAVRGLEMASPMEVDQRMDLIGQLDDPFALLRRDSQTFAKQFRDRRRLENVVSRPKDSKVRGKCKLWMDGATERLLDSVIYADVSGDTIRLLGSRDGKASLSFSSDTLRQVSVVQIDGFDLSRYRPHHFAKLGRGADPVVLIGGRRDNQTALPKQVLDLDAAGLERLDRCIVSNRGIISGLRANGELTFVQAQINERDIKSVSAHLVQDLTIFALTRMHWQGAGDDSQADLRLVAIDERVFLFVGTRSALITKNEPVFWGGLRLPIIECVTSLPATRKRMVVIDGLGLVVYWLEETSFRQEEVADGEFLKLCLLRNGFLAVASETSISIFQSTPNGYIRRCSVRRIVRSPIVSMMTWKHDGFLIAYQNGVVERWKVRK